MEVARFAALVQDSTSYLLHQRFGGIENEIEPVGSGFAAIISTQIDEYGEFIRKPFVETLREVTAEILTELRRVNGFAAIQQGERADYWQRELKAREEAGQLNLQVTSFAGEKDNYQRKILPWEELESSMREQKKRQRNEIIVVASLIDRIPNLAGLTRTCEIMNAQALVIGNRLVVKSQEFESIAVTAQKWLPIYEVAERRLSDYLRY